MSSSNPPGDDPTDAPLGRPLRVLIAEDHPAVRRAMVRLVRNLGHEITEACDGQEAVEAIAASPYDLLLLDLSMPRMTGTDVVTWLRDHPEHSELLVVVMSAWAREERPRLLDLGVELVLPKPFREQQLAELIETHFST